ncbi:MAG: tRNA epoxyqueuosine(34) reductase QueG [Porticoccaceae bacterium]|nr:tRNA epoxyqueuosine(34) reductase QueG [Porticoccaceae bacterium]
MGKSAVDLFALAENIKAWGAELGFQQIAITDTNLEAAGQRLGDWLNCNYQGDMTWLAEHGDKRWRPDKLLPETVRVITARMDYLPAASGLVKTLRNPDKAYISRYALGRDYHKLIRKRLAKLAEKIDACAPGTVIQRPFVDSAPVLEKPLAEKAGLGWMGKNTLILNSEAGSWFFLGEIYTSLPLPLDQSQQHNQCGNCSACLNICPTNAFPQPYVLDARRCISYLTIEHKGAIDEALRPLMGNRVFGCDDCQAICPWNRYARASGEDDFRPRHRLEDSDLVTLFQWSEQEFEEKTAGSTIRRIGYERWQRNLAVGLGNATPSAEVITALANRRVQASPLVADHIDWALKHQQSANSTAKTKVKRFPAIDISEAP